MRCVLCWWSGNQCPRKNTVLTFLGRAPKYALRGERRVLRATQIGIRHGLLLVSCLQRMRCMRCGGHVIAAHARRC